MPHDALSACIANTATIEQVQVELHSRVRGIKHHLERAYGEGSLLMGYNEATVRIRGE